MFDLPLTLEELYAGTTKKRKVTRTSSTLQREASTVLIIDVKPGWKAGTKVGRARPRSFSLGLPTGWF